MNLLRRGCGGAEITRIRVRALAQIRAPAILCRYITSNPPHAFVKDRSEDRKDWNPSGAKSAALPEASSGDPPPLLYRVPVISPILIGRQQELLHLWQQLLSGKRLQILSGVDGIGKSSVAAEFCDRAKRSGRFSCVQWCQGRQAIHFQLQRLFEEMRGRRELDVLLVIDDAVQINKLIPLLPKHPSFYVVMTTQEEVPLQQLPPYGQVLPLAPLRPEEMTEFFPVGVSTSDSVGSVVEFCENVPLLVKMSIALVTETVAEPDSLLQILKKSNVKKDGVLSVSKALKVLLDLALEAIEKEHRHGRRTLRMLSCLDVEDCSDLVLQAFAGGAALEFSSTAAKFCILAMKWENGSFRIHWSIAELLRHEVCSEDLALSATHIADMWPRRWREMASSQGWSLVWHSYSLMQQFHRHQVPCTAALVQTLDRSAMFLAHYARQDLPIAAEMWSAALEFYRKDATTIDRAAVRIGRECGRLLHFLRDDSAQTVLDSAYQWSCCIHGEQSVETALVLGCLAPYLTAESPSALQQLKSGVATLEAARGSTDVVLSVEETRMLQETQFVLLMRQGQIIQEKGMEVPASIWSTLQSLEDQLSAAA